MNETDLRRLLDALPSEVRRRVCTLRNVIRRTVPRAQESALWGGLSYHRPDVGGRVKGAVCQINFKLGRVRLEFIHGIRLADPAGLLQGHLVSKRFVPIEDPTDAGRPEIAALIREAAALDPTKLADPPGRVGIETSRGSRASRHRGK